MVINRSSKIQKAFFFATNYRKFYTSNWRLQRKWCAFKLNINIYIRLKQMDIGVAKI